ncbi:unnamed protein product [Ostreobium quekettii]|uniref:Tetratricopeptide repeat protein n=1 Tax=Ostreobium quekettii TaxID=121088 RepID=A0A8S1IY28_9CHLO|nr:unnamed protein product [Ostreobium quekettii]|eukprot:evm.model.scf_1683EXC.4 EVM.evm.TU.scf_1683EXC.4   scf_1683EXC:8435-11240(+)
MGAPSLPLSRPPSQRARNQLPRCLADSETPAPRFTQSITRHSHLSRRAAVASLPLIAIVLRAPIGSAAVEAPAAVIVPGLAPDQSRYDAADPELRAAAGLVREALEAGSLEEEEELWTRIIDGYGGRDAEWAPDVVGRALGNRGNARSRRGDLAGAVADYNAAIEACPWSVDPVLNRGVALEALGRWDEAIRDYRSVLKVAPFDPSALNNLGNAYAGKGQWDEAERYYGRAVALAPEFAFAAANRACALYQLGRVDDSLRLMRNLLRRYPTFPDMRAALTVALWRNGEEGEAEEEWLRVDDPRYRDVAWLKESRRWPPDLITGMEAFLELKSRV